MAKNVKYGKQLHNDYKKAMERQRYYNKKFNVEDSSTKKLLQTANKSYRESLKKYKEGHTSKSELLRHREELTNLVKLVNRTYSKQNKKLATDITTDESKVIKTHATERGTTEYTRRLGLHGYEQSNVYDRLDTVAIALGRDTDEVIQEIYREGKEGKINTSDVKMELDNRTINNNTMVENYREIINRRYDNGEIDKDLRDMAIKFLS